MELEEALAILDEEPLGHRIGEPDPTPHLPHGGYCDEPVKFNGVTRTCTWGAGHEGPHVSGDSDGTIHAVWR